jgi:hypothetical protein
MSPSRRRDPALIAREDDSARRRAIRALNTAREMRGL